LPFKPLAEPRMIIESLLDTDLYKFTMMQVVLHHFPGAQVEYRFKCRTPDVDLTPYLDQIEREIIALCSLRFTHEELEYLRRWRFLKSDFVDLLGLFQLDRRFISLSPAAVPGEIDITIKGPWLHTILFEVPVLAIVSEVYFRETIARPDLAEGRRRLRHAAPILPRLAGRSRAHAETGDRPQVRRDQQCQAGVRPQSDAAGHDGARIHAGLPGGGTA